MSRSRSVSESSACCLSTPVKFANEIAMCGQRAIYKSDSARNGNTIINTAGLILVTNVVEHKPTEMQIRGIISNDNECKQLYAEDDKLRDFMRAESSCNCYPRSEYNN